MSEKMSFFRAQAEKGIVRHVDGSSVDCICFSWIIRVNIVKSEMDLDNIKLYAMFSYQ